MAASVSDRKNGDDGEFSWSCDNEGRCRLFRKLCHRVRVMGQNWSCLNFKIYSRIDQQCLWDWKFGHRGC